MSDTDRGPGVGEQGPVMPVPVPNFDNAEFWAGCAAGELRLQRCAGCGALRHPPKPMCPHCRSTAVEWQRASGRGTVYSFTIVHRPTLAPFEPRVPYNVIVVQLDEGPYLVSNLVDCAPEAIRIGMRVEVVFERVNDALMLPKFRPR